MRVEAGKRHLVNARGQPFLIHGDTPWSIEVQLTRPQILAYLDDRQAKGFTALMFQCMEHEFSSQDPPWKNAEGHQPFSTAGSFGARVEAYWQLLDFVIAEANQRSIVCIVHPAYLGFGGGNEGWSKEVQQASEADLHAYGAFLATRYRGRGVIWCMGGDYNGNGHPGLREKQWNIATGLRSVDAAVVITAQGPRGRSAHSDWAGSAGLNLNNIYTNGSSEYEHAAVEYARPGPLPFFLIEGIYDGEGATEADCRRQAYATVLSGGCGHLFGNSPLWGFGDPKGNKGRGAADALANSLGTPATLQMRHVRQLFGAFEWWKLEPKTDTSLVITALGSAKSRICPALASDRSFAMVWTTGAPFTVNLAALGPARVRARWYDTVSGLYSDVAGTPFGNAGTQALAPPGERVLVLDAA